MFIQKKIEIIKLLLRLFIIQLLKIKKQNNMETLKNTLDCGILDKNEIDIVLYHGHCSDGFGCAFIVWNYYRENFSLEKANAIKYIPCYHSCNDTQFDKIVEKITTKNVLMCDFSYKFSQLQILLSKAKSFLILDHHKTAKENLAKISNSYKIFDMEKAGVGLTWEYFYPETSLPIFLDYIQDRDLWTYEIPHTLEFVTYFFELDQKFEVWLPYLDITNVRNAITKGKEWLEYQNIVLGKIIKRTSWIIQEYNNQYIIVLYCNSIYSKSDIGHGMLQKYTFGDFACIWDYDLHNNKTSHSLRSTNDKIDVSQIAKMYGGGGHRNAAALSFDNVSNILPLDVINDHGLLDMLQSGTKGEITLVKNNCKYILFQVESIREEWLEKKYFDLLKRKCTDSSFIVFKTKTENVHVESDSLEIKPIYEYSTFYNEKSVGNQESILKLLIFGDKDTSLVFVSHEEFSDLWSTNKSENNAVDTVDNSNVNSHYEYMKQNSTV